PQAEVGVAVEKPGIRQPDIAEQAARADFEAGAEIPQVAAEVPVVVLHAEDAAFIAAEADVGRGSAGAAFDHAEGGIELAAFIGGVLDADGGEGPGGEQLLEAEVEDLGVEPLAAEVLEALGDALHLGLYGALHDHLAETLAGAELDDEPRRESAVGED